MVRRWRCVSGGSPRRLRVLLVRSPAAWEFVAGALLSVWGPSALLIAPYTVAPSDMVERFCGSARRCSSPWRHSEGAESGLQEPALGPRWQLHRSTPRHRSRDCRPHVAREGPRQCATRLAGRSLLQRLPLALALLSCLPALLFPSRPLAALVATVLSFAPRPGVLSLRGGAASKALG